MTLFEHETYKPYLAEKAEERGAKAAWADALGCQRGYITAVVGGSAHFSLEQAERLARFFGLTEEESDYFLLLIQKDRAGTDSLRAYFEGKLREMRERRQMLRTRYRDTRELTLEQRVQFYSSWVYSAVHVCLFAGMRTREEIAMRLALPPARVNEIVEFLMEAGFVREKKDGTLEGHFPRTFLAGDSPLIKKHHLNWRLRAMQSVEDDRPTDLHYSSNFSVSVEDYARVREALLATIDRFKKTVADSREESEVCALTLDLFRL